MRRTAVSCARLEKARTTSQVPTRTANTRGNPCHGWDLSTVTIFPPGSFTARAAPDAARKTLITACSHVAGVSGVPKHPQLDTEPWRSRMTDDKSGKDGIRNGYQCGQHRHRPDDGRRPEGQLARGEQRHGQGQEARVGEDAGQAPHGVGGTDGLTGPREDEQRTRDEIRTDHGAEVVGVVDVGATVVVDDGAVVEVVGEANGVDEGG